MRAAPRTTTAGNMTEDRNLRIGIVGLGKMGIAHMAILNTVEDVEIAAFVEKQKMIRKGVESVLPGVGLYDDHREMLSRERLDAAVIAAPTSLHVGIARDCLERGVNVFVEKPLGLSCAEAEPLIDLAGKNGAFGMVGYCKHFVETFEKARGMLRSGELGAPVHFSSYMYVSQLFQTGSGWRYKKQSSGGGVLNILATHLVDLLVWFFGDPVSVTGQLKSYYSEEVEDYVHAYLAFGGGLAGGLDASWSIRNYRLPEIKVEVQCERGMLSVTEDWLRYSSDSDEKVKVLYKQDLFSGVPVYVGGSEYTREDLCFVECLRTGARPEIDLDYGCRVQRVTDAVYESAEKRATVDLPPWREGR